MFFPGGIFIFCQKILSTKLRYVLRIVQNISFCRDKKMFFLLQTFRNSSRPQVLITKCSRLADWRLTAKTSIFICLDWLTPDSWTDRCLHFVLWAESIYCILFAWCWLHGTLLKMLRVPRCRRNLFTDTGLSFFLIRNQASAIIGTCSAMAAIISAAMTTNIGSSASGQ